MLDERPDPKEGDADGRRVIPNPTMFDQELIERPIAIFWRGCGCRDAKNWAEVLVVRE